MNSKAGSGDLPGQIGDFAALYRDPPANADAPAQTLAKAISSGGVNLNAVLYVASGAGPHPTALLLHGLPGNEQNIDLAQSMRRAGWNVLTIHYRGSWGGPGHFSFEHCLEDATAALDWVRGAGGDATSRIDPNRIVVLGHSMGGFVAAHLFAKRPEMQGAVMISGVDLGCSFGSAKQDRSEARIDANVGFGAGLHILARTSPEALAGEARSHADQWRLTNYASRLRERPFLVVTANDGFASNSDAFVAAARALDSGHVTQAHFATDHSYSGCRIGLQATILSWLAQFAIAPSPIVGLAANSVG